MRDDVISKMSRDDANGERTQNLEFLHQALMTGKPTSVESERCFSNAGVFATKVRSRLGDRSLCDLVSLRMYFQYKERKQRESRDKIN